MLIGGLAQSILMAFFRVGPYRFVCLIFDLGLSTSKTRAIGLHLGLLNQLFLFCLLTFPDVLPCPREGFFFRRSWDNGDSNDRCVDE